MSQEANEIAEKLKRENVYFWGDEVKLNNTKAEYPEDKTLNELFEEQVIENIDITLKDTKISHKVLMLESDVPEIDFGF